MITNSLNDAIDFRALFVLKTPVPAPLIAESMIRLNHFSNSSYRNECSGSDLSCTTLQKMIFSLSISPAKYDNDSYKLSQNSILYAFDSFLYQFRIQLCLKMRKVLRVAVEGRYRVYNSRSKVIRFDHRVYFISSGRCL